MDKTSNRTKHRVTANDQEQKEFFLTYLNQVGFFNLKELHPLYKQTDPEQIDDIRLKVVMMAGIGKTLSLEGDFIEAKGILDTAQEIAEKNRDTVKNDYLAFIYYEQCLFYGKVWDYLQAERYAVLANKHAVNENLQLLIRFQIEFLNAHKTSQTDVAGIIPYVNEFHKRKMVFMEVMVMIRLGIIYEGRKDWKNALDYFSKALKIAKEINIYYLVDMIYNSIGFTYANKGEYDKALNVLNTALEDVKSYYLRTLMVENIGFVYYQKLDYRTASEKYLEAYNIAKINHVVDQLPEECTYLGDCYTRLNQPQQALSYYKQGYDYAMEQIRMGFSFTGVRKDAVKAYIQYLETIAYSKFDEKPMEALFQFALGKTWKEIHQLFQYHFMMAHLNQTHIREVFFRRLHVSPSTFFSAKSRLQKEGFVIPNIGDRVKEYDENHKVESLALYIERYSMDLDWKDADKRFEHDMFRYLFQQYGFQRRRLEEILQISYPSVWIKINEISDSNENTIGMYALK